MRKIMTAMTALALIAAPTTAAMAQGNNGRGEEMSEGRRAQMGHGIAFAVVAIIIVFALFLVFNNDDDEAESP